MSAPAKTNIEMADFPGMLVNADARDFPAGAAELQNNIGSVQVGELTVRLGIKEVAFEDS